MTTNRCWLGTLIVLPALAACGILPGTIACAEDAQPKPQQAPVQRDDPATSGAGPTSRSPGQLDYDDRKGAAPTTTDSRGVTTTQPSRNGEATQPPADQGNESMSSTTPR